MAKGPTIKFPDGASVEIVDPNNIVPAYADIITEFREVDGVIYLSLGSFIIDGDGEVGKRVQVVSRLRIAKQRAATIYGILGNLLKDDPPQAEKRSMN